MSLALRLSTAESCRWTSPPLTQARRQESGQRPGGRKRGREPCVEKRPARGKQVLQAPSVHAPARDFMPVAGCECRRSRRIVLVSQRALASKGRGLLLVTRPAGAKALLTTTSVPKLPRPTTVGVGMWSSQKGGGVPAEGMTRTRLKGVTSSGGGATTPWRTAGPGRLSTGTMGCAGAHSGASGGGEACLLGRRPPRPEPEAPEPDAPPPDATTV